MHPSGGLFCPLQTPNMAAFEIVKASQAVGEENILDFYTKWADDYEKVIW